MKRKITVFIFFSLLLIVNLALGGEIKDTESATHGTDASSHSIVDTYTFPGFKVIQFTLPVLSIYSYMLISDGEALMVDPVRDVFFYLETAKKEGVTIKGVYLTHSHADFIAGHSELVKALNCPIYQSHKSGAQYPFNAVDENSNLKLGQATLKFMDTPGHTPDGMCCAVYSKDQPETPKLLFTGDVLFVGSVGRPDLMEGTLSAAWLAGAMFDSWTKKLAKLNDSVMVFPAHGAGSLCGAHLSDEPNSTIGKERTSNPYLKYTKRSEFIAAVLEGLPDAPQYFKHNALTNRQGPPLVDWTAPLPSELQPSSGLTDPEKYYVVDIRDSKPYAEGHIPRSVNIAARGRLETWIGTIVPWDAKTVLVGNNEQIKEGIFRLHRIGYKPEVMTMESWVKAKLPITVNAPIAPRELYDLMEKGQAPIIVDVRLPSEWMGLRIGTVINLPLNKLAALSSLLDPQEPLVTVCNSAYRSSMAVGILERKGFTKARSLEGGSEAWIKDGLPVIEPTKPSTSSGEKSTQPESATAAPKNPAPKPPDAGC